MNPTVTSKEEILVFSKELISKQGWKNFQIRALAQACHISIGSIYNYFGSKTELMEELIENIWLEIFHQEKELFCFDNILDCVNWIYERLEYGQKKYPDFLTSHAQFKWNESASQRMNKIRKHMLNEIQNVLKRDEKIIPEAFSEEFSVDKFAETLFGFIWMGYERNMILEIVKRTLYGGSI